MPPTWVEDDPEKGFESAFEVWEVSDFLLAVDTEDGHKADPEGKDSDDEGTHHGENIPKDVLDAEKNGTDSTKGANLYQDKCHVFKGD